MPASSFADLMISKLESSIGKDGYSYSSSTPNIANQAVAEGITEYLTQNTTINITYAGVMPNGSPDPIVTDVCKVTGTCSPPSGTEFDPWIKSLESNIVSGFFIDRGTAGVTPLAPKNSYLPGLSLNRSMIQSVHESNLEDPQKPVWETICNAILIWLNATNAGPYPASTSSSTGTATVIKTTVI